MSPLGPADDAARVASRLARASSGLSLGGIVLGLFAVGALVSAGGRLDASSLPPVLLLGIGQVGGLVGAAGCALRVPPVRNGTVAPHTAAAAAVRSLDRLLPAVAVVAALSAAAMPVLLRPVSTAAFAALVSLALVAQLLVLVAVLRAPLRREAR